VLVTSRQQLRLQAEWTFEVTGLSVPEDRSVESAAAHGSVALFLQSARRIQPDFSPSPEEMLAIVHVCYLVDGMPLAIELAAAWVKTLSCREIAAEIERDLDLLETELQDVPLRQRSVRAIFEHAWNALSPAEQSVFASLSVCRGGFTRSAAQQIAGAGVKVLSELVSRSFLTRDDSGRFQVHELLRQFAAHKLAANTESCQATEERHATYFASLLKDLEPAIVQGARTEPIEQINRELDNVLLAGQWAIEHRSASLFAAGMRSLFWFYETKAWYSEGEEAFRAAAEAVAAVGQANSSESQRLQQIETNLRVRQAWFASRQSRYKEVLSLPWLTAELNADFVDQGDLEASWVAGGVLVNTLYGLGDYDTAHGFLSRYDERMERDHDYGRAWPWAKGHNLANLGRLAGALGRYEEARELLQEGVDILRPVGDHVGVMLYLHTLGGIQRILGDAGHARGLFQEGFDLAETHRYPMGKILALGDLGSLAYAEGEYASAKQHFELSLALSEEIGDSRGRALALTNLGRVAIALGAYDEARDLFERGLAITERSGNRRGTALTLDRLSQVHRLLNDLDRALALCQQSWQICQELGYRKGSILALISRGEIALEQAAFREAEQDFQDSLAASEAMGFVSGIMRSHIGLGRAALEMGDLRLAEAHLRQGLTVGGESRQKRAELNALLCLAETLVASGEVEDGVQLLALAASHPAADLLTREKAAADLEVVSDSVDPARFESLVARGRNLSLNNIRETWSEAAAE